MCSRFRKYTYVITSNGVLTVAQALKHVAPYA